MTEIVVISSDIPSAGAPHQHMAAYWLSSRGWKITLICPSNDKSDAQTPLGPVVIDAIQATGRIRRQWQLFRKILRYRFAGTRVFYVQGASAGIASLIALLGVRRARRIYHTQDFLEPGRYPLREFFERCIARRSGWVILNEYSRARFMASWYRLPAMPAVVRTALPRGWPLPEPAPALRHSILAQFPSRELTQDVRLIAAGGGYSPLRCGEQLLEALAKVPANYRVVFSAMTPDSLFYHDLLKHADALGVRQRICILPKLKYAELLALFSACDIGILLYPNEGIGSYFQQPGRLTEYMLAGLPFVASNFPGLELAVVKYGLGAVASPASSRAIADALLSIGERNADERASQRARLRELAKTEFAYESQAGHLELILEQALGKRPPIR